MARSKSSQRWLREHFDDSYVKLAREKGYRSRAVFKLLEINARDHILRPGMTVIDLGAAPGGWSQAARDLVGAKGRVIALDILPIDSISGVEIMQGDFRQDEVMVTLLSVLGNDQVDLVMSDMAPNMSGMKSVDQPRAVYLVELALDLARKVLVPGGDLLVKAFQGEGFDEMLRELRKHFAKVQTRKPEASRSRSPELYVLARDYRPE